MLDKSEREKNEQEDLIKSAHANWMKSPITVAILKKIHDHRDKFIDILSVESFNVTKTPVEKIRLYAAGINTCDAVIELITSPTELIISPNQQNKL